MIGGRAGGWQTIIADLALILFMVSISASAPPAAASRQAGGIEAPAPLPAAPSAIYRATQGAPTLARWLAGQPRDPRQRLTILARHRAGAEPAAAAAALALAAEARAQGHAARIVIEPAAADELLAMLAFDAPQDPWHDDCSAGADGAPGAARNEDIACR
ncbi:MAG: hypothetical protein H5U21_02400 [Porphyrobacter sp.]|nr:hypothetical protein [Porphyrobacter sp.]